MSCAGVPKIEHSEFAGRATKVFTRVGVVTNSEQTREIHNAGTAFELRVRMRQQFVSARRDKGQTKFGFRNKIRGVNFLHMCGIAMRSTFGMIPPLYLGAYPMLPAGKSLRTLREKLGLTMRDVENSSARIADKYRNEEFSIPPSRLSAIETKGILPSIFRLYTLSVIYRRDFRELMSWYGVDLNHMATDLGLVSPPKSHVSDALAGVASVQVPVRMDPGFDERLRVSCGWRLSDDLDSLRWTLR